MKTSPSIVTLLIGFAFTIVTTVPTVILYTVFFLYRYLIGLYLRYKHGQSIKFLEGADGLMALKDANGPFEIHAHVIFKGSPDITAFREHARKILLDQKSPDGTWRHPKIRQLLYRELGYTFWGPNPNFQFENNVVMYQGSEINNRDDLNRLFGEQMTNPLPPELTWKISLVQIPDEFPGLDTEPHYVMCWKFLHAICDGVAAIRMICELFDERLGQMPAKRMKVQSYWELFVYIIHCFCLGPLYFTQDLLTREDHVLKARKLTGVRLAGLTIPLSVERFKRVKNRTRTTINDVFLACWSGALRRHFIAEKASIPETVNVHFPISFHDLSKPVELINRCSTILFRIPVAEKTPLKRLEACQETASELQNSPTIPYNYYIQYTRLCTVLPDWIIRPLIDTYMPTAIASNVPGPQQYCSCVGNQLLSLGFFVPTRSTSGLGLSATSTRGYVQFGLKVDTAVIQKQEIVERFLNYIINEFEELEKAVFAEPDI